ncbi:MAG: hypothetical protein ACYTGW_14470 [Planctomycetota bacterium]|jgi:hypothetical protein
MTTGGPQSRAKLTREQLVKQFISYLKASFVYPVTNPRVTKPAEAIISGLEQYRDPRGMLRLCLHGDAFRVNKQRVVIPEAIMSWAKKAFVKTAISGVDIGPILPKESLAQFAKRLQENFQSRSGTEFQSKWPDSYPGLRPLELFIDGQHVFVKEHDGDATLCPELRKDSDEEPVDRGSREAVLLHALEADSRLLERLDKMRQRINLEMLNERTLAGVDVLTQLVRTMPVEAFNDINYANECVQKILNVVETRMMAMVSTGQESEPELFSLLVSVGRKIFGSTQGGDKERPAPGDPSGRPEDELFTDDLETLLTEYDDLPSSDDVKLEVRRDLKDEMLGILLHSMVSAEEEEVANGLTPMLSRLVREAEQSKELLAAYVDGCMTHRGKTTEEKPRWRVVDFVQGHGFAGLLGHDDLLRTDTVAFAFPYLFSHFVDSLRWDNDNDLSKIGDVCYGVGPERIRAAKDFLLDEGGVLVAARTRKILAKPSKDVLPLAEIILEDGSQWITPLAAQFLRQLKMPGTASLALRAVHPVTMLPRSYLIGLCRAAFEDKFPATLADQSASLVCRFIRNTADDSSQCDRRIYAIQSLRGVRSQEVLALLMELKAACGPLTLNKELRAVRKAAIEVLDYHTGGKD